MLLLSLIMSFYLCGLGVKESRLEQLDEIQVKAINTSNGKNLRPRPEDADISWKGADDHVGLYVSTGSLASG